MTLTSEYSYHLAERLIAQTPSERRDDSRMMLVDRNDGRIAHHGTKDLPMLLDCGDLLVVNDTKVIPARIDARKSTGGRMELLFIEEISENVWSVLIKCARRPRPGSEFTIGNDLGRARMIEDCEMGRALIEILDGCSVPAILGTAGRPPLPPYIKRMAADSRSDNDSDRYQTIYAERPGAVAAPTAGLHFTPELFARLESMGVERSNITLHVGPGTFRPVSSEHLEDHIMESERYEISELAAEKISGRSGRCVAVGSTSVRTLETNYARNGRICAEQGRSELFIHPPYRFRAVDAMLTNFHLPCSTLLMMVCAFGGTELIMEAYRQAVEQEYRFYSYGDCMLIL